MGNIIIISKDDNTVITPSLKLSFSMLITVLATALSDVVRMGVCVCICVQSVGVHKD